MSLKCSAFIATSLDGYIARPDGSIDWLERAGERAPASASGEAEDYGYAAYMASVDALVMGRHSFELVLSFPDWPYGTMPVHVLSRRLERLPSAAPATVSLSADTPAQLVQRLEAAGAGHLYIDGGVTIQGFLRAGLLDELTVTRIPVLLGVGRPLFGPLAADVALEHVATRSFPSGFVQSVYRLPGRG